METTSKSYLAVTMRGIVSNTVIGDEGLKEELKPWRKRLREICNDSSSCLLEHLTQSKLEIVEKYKEFVSDKSEILCQEEPVQDEFAELRAANKNVLSEYLESMNQMFDSYAKIETGLTELEELEHEFTTLSCMETDNSSAEFCALQTSIEAFVQKKYEASKIAEDYAIFSKSYARWKVLRSVVLQAHVAQEMSGGPFCSICTSERVNIALTPCGHTYCNNCAQKQKTTCFICRTAVKDRLRIFFT